MHACRDGDLPLATGVPVGLGSAKTMRIIQVSRFGGFGQETESHPNLHNYPKKKKNAWPSCETGSELQLLENTKNLALTLGAHTCTIRHCVRVSTQSHPYKNITRLCPPRLALNAYMQNLCKHACVAKNHCNFLECLKSPP